MSFSYQDLVSAARNSIVEVDPSDLDGRLTDVAVIDIREAEEFEHGVIPGAALVPRGLLEQTIATHVPRRDTEVVLYCAVGARSALAALTLQQMGYTSVRSLRGGFNAWKNAGLAWHAPDGLTSDQRARYSRHTLLPEVGEAGQLRLLDSRVRSCTTWNGLGRQRSSRHGKR
jgi:rhodanese-related sulfurtransferase